jgi:sialate O-acetylesterase
MAVTLDAGMYDDIHPLRKIVIGERLAAAALAMHRGEPDSAPRMERVAFVDSVAVIHLDSVTSSMEARRVEMREGKQRARPVGARYIAEAGVPHGFTIAGIDRVFHPAEATIDGQTIRVRSAAVLEPVAVRYGWSNFTLANIYDADGRPLPPFRSDAWPRTPPAQP